MFQSSTWRFAALTCCLSSAAAVSHAAESTGPEGEMETVVVQAARTEQPATAIAGTVMVIDREAIEIQSNIADDLTSVLSNTVPGFAPSIRKLTGRSETLRGRNPLYLVDGVPQHNALRDGQRDGHTIDLAFVERIEVINGSNAIQGVGATGGVVNTVTKSAILEPEWDTTVQARFTSADDFEDDGYGYKLSALTGRGNGTLGFIAGIALHERGLFFDADGDAIGLYPTQGDIMDSTSLSLFGQAEWRPAENTSFVLMINDFDLERNGDFRSVDGDRALGIPTGTIEGDPSPEVGEPARNEVTTVSLTWRQAEVLGGSFEAQLYDQDYEALFEGGTFGGFFRLTPGGPPFLDQSQIESEKTGVKTTYNRRFDRVGVNFTGGVDFFRDDSAQVLARSGREWVPETRFETVSPFAQVGWDVVEALTLSGGVRYEDASLEVDDYTTIASAGSTFVSGGEPSFDETLLNAGAIWRVTDNVNLYGAYSEGFTMPDVGRVLRAVSTPGQDVDSLVTIEPIVTDNIEFGVEFDNGPLNARLTYFESEADNGSRLRTNAAGIFEVERQRTEIDGFEVAVDYRIADWIGVGGNYAKTDGEFDSDDDGAVDSDLDGLNIGPDRLNLYVDGSFREAFRWRIQLSHLEDRDFDGPAAPTDANFDGYTVADLFVAWRSGFGEFSLAMENVFNEDYFTYFAQTEPNQRADTYFTGVGRTISLGWQHRF